MLNKIILLAIGMILLIGIVSAVEIEENDIYTQETFDSINFTSVDLKCDYNGFLILPISNTLSFNFSCLSAKKITQDNKDVTYKIFRQYNYYPVQITYFLNCIMLNPSEFCINEVHNLVIGQYYNGKKILRKSLANMQTHNTELKPNDIVFTKEELNKK